ncbi:MAG: hypothetical protein V4649_00180 [Bacteroidota bacterium]
MASKSLDSQLQQYWPLLEKEEKQSILGVIKSFLKLKDTHTHAERISVEQYNKEIDEAVDRVKSGQFYTNEEVQKMSEKW